MIIGLTGKLGAGKGEAAKFFMEKGFVYHSCSDILREELRERGVGENIDNLAKLGNKIREKYGAGELAGRIVEKIRDGGEERAVVDSLRNPGEIEELKKQEDFFLLGIDAPIEVRYERVKSRKRAGDDVSFEKFKSQEEKQLEGGGKQQQLNRCMEMADFVIINDGKIEELHSALQEIYKEIKRKE